MGALNTDIRLREEWSQNTRNKASERRPVVAHGFSRGILISNGHKPRRGGRNVALNLPHPLQTLLSSPMISIAFISSPSLLLKETKSGEFHVPEIIANDSP